MKLAKKFGLLVATTVAAIGLTSVAYGFGQKDAGATYVKVNFWNEGDINYPDEIDYQYCSDKSFDASKTKDFNRVEGKSIYTIENLDPGKSYWVRYRESGLIILLHLRLLQLQDLLMNQKLLRYLQQRILLHLLGQQLLEQQDIALWMSIMK